MREDEQLRADLLALLKSKSVFHGDFTLASGGKSKYYVDCKLTTLDPKGAWLAGQVLRAAVRRQEAARGISIDALGGLTMGADPIALATGMVSHWEKDEKVLQVFSVRKSPKAHGQTKLIEGNFKNGDTVVVLDDVITRGESTLAAINAVEKEGGKIAFIMALVDREEGGRKAIEARGYEVIAIFNREELFGEPAQSPPRDNRGLALVV
jgi:orotate phosphoribosyltransferase